MWVHTRWVIGEWHISLFSLPRRSDLKCFFNSHTTYLNEDGYYGGDSSKTRCYFVDLGVVITVYCPVKEQLYWGTWKGKKVIKTDCFVICCERQDSLLFYKEKQWCWRNRLGLHQVISNVFHATFWPSSNPSLLPVERTPECAAFRHVLQFLTLESCSSSVIAAETAAFPVSLFGIGSLLGDYRNTLHRFIQGINSMMEILACEWIAVLGLMPLN